MADTYISKFQMPDGSVAQLKDERIQAVDTQLNEYSQNPVANAAVAAALKNIETENIIKEVQYPDVPDMPAPYLIIGPEKIYEPVQNEWHDFNYTYITGDNNWTTFGFMQATGVLDIRNIEIRHAETGDLLYSQFNDSALGEGAMGTTLLPHNVGMYYFGYWNNSINVGAGISQSCLTIESRGDDINSRIVIVKSGTYIGENIPTIISGQWKVTDYAPNQSLFCLQWLKTPGVYKIKGDGELLVHGGSDYLLELKTIILNGVTHRYFTIFCDEGMTNTDYTGTFIQNSNTLTKEVTNFPTVDISYIQSDWKKFWIFERYREMRYGEEILTGEIFKGYPVYAKMCYFGTPINGTKMIVDNVTEMTVIRHHGHLGSCSLPYNIGGSTWSAHSYTNGREITLKCTNDFADPDHGLTYGWTELVEYIKKWNLNY